MTDLVLHTRVVSGQGGGPDKTILNSPRFLVDDGYPMVCAYMRDPSDPGFTRIEEMAKKWEAPLEAVDDRGLFDRGVVRRLHELCEHHRPAIWHGHDYKSNYLGLRLRRKISRDSPQDKPMALVTTVHGWGVKGSWKTALYYAFDRRLMRRYDQVICVSQDLYDRCLQFGVPDERCWLVPNAIDTDEYCRTAAPSESSLRTETPPNRLVIGAVGRLSPEKAFDDLIRAFAQLVGQGLDVELWIVGEGPERALLDGLVGDLRLRDRVRLLGYRSDTLEFYRAMDMYALSSRREGLPNVLLEAMALEIPVVATRIAGIPQLIESERNGLLVDPGEVDELATALHRLSTEAELRGRLGSQGRATIEERHSMGGRMRRMREIYEVALGRKPRTS